MNENAPHIHYTNQIMTDTGQNLIWEFQCPHCDYRARYIVAQVQEMQMFWIITIGDPAARHMNNPSTSPLEWQPDVADIPSQEIDENWLTPELRKQIEAILQKFDQDSDPV